MTTINRRRPVVGTHDRVADLLYRRPAIGTSAQVSLGTYWYRRRASGMQRLRQIMQGRR